MIEEQRSDETGQRAMFWIWTGIIAVGLAAMIATPLMGR